jgi:hypothetical protein
LILRNGARSKVGCATAEFCAMTQPGLNETGLAGISRARRSEWVAPDWRVSMRPPTIVCGRWGCGCIGRSTKTRRGAAIGADAATAPACLATKKQKAMLRWRVGSRLGSPLCRSAA